MLIFKAQIYFIILGLLHTQTLNYGWWVGMVLSKDILLKCIATADRYSSAGVGGLCVGTRQALLQGWLLCVGFVCLANVPDLVCWVVSAKSWMLKCLQDVV